MEEQHSPPFFGEWLRVRRKALDLTQVELGERAGCSVSALRKLESGERRPSKELAHVLASALEIPDGELATFVRVARGELSLERLSFPSSPVASRSLPEPKPPFPPVQLPKPLTHLVGRESELAAMARIFKVDLCRLLTLTGPGGIGKTSLAIEFAASQLSRFPGGVIFVPLAPLKSPNLIVPAVADALGFNFSGSVDPKEQLISFISGQEKQAMLLLLDNVEHLLDPRSNEQPGTTTAGLIVEILQRLPDVKILASSRERLNLHGEWTYELHGLPVPPADFTGDPEDFSAIALFLQSARRVKADFRLTEENQPAIVRICQFVEGNPLAIEMASAWVGVLPSAEIAREVESNLDLLASSFRDIPERHRSIRATFDHSWNLLTKEERAVLSQLAVFRGGFDRRAAEQVTGASLPILASLVSKSLIRRTEGGRYDLHELIRQYAFSHLLNDPQYHAIHDRHCKYYLGLARDREQALKSAAQQSALRELMGEMDNLRAAWARAIERGLYVPLGQAVRSLGWLFETAGLLIEGIDQFELLIRKQSGSFQNREFHKALGLAYTQQSLLYFRRGEFDRAQNLLEESLATLRPLSDQTLLTDSLVYLGIITHLNGELDRSRMLLEEGLTCAQAGGDQWFAAYAIFNQGYLDSLTGRYQQGYEQMMAGLSIWRELGDPRSIALGLNFLSPTLIKLGRSDEAVRTLKESISLCAHTGDRWGAGTAYRYLGLTYLKMGDLGEAQTLFQKSLDNFSGFVTGWDIALTLNFLGEAKIAAGDFQAAEQTLLKALRTAIKARAALLALDALASLAVIKAHNGEFDLAALLTAFISKHEDSPEETIKRATQLLSELEKQVPVDQIQAARNRAADHTLETIIEEIA